MAKLTYKKRKKLKSSEFAEPGKRKYPINDRSHAKNALARVSQFGTQTEKATVRKKVHAKFPTLASSSRKMPKSYKAKRKRVFVKV